MKNEKSGEILTLRFAVCIFHFALIFLLPAVALCSEQSSWKWIEGPTIQSMLKEGGALWLIDVRSSKAYDTEHIEGSVNIPLVSLKYKKFPLNKKLIIVDDSLGQKMSREAAEMLVKNGHERVYVLEGGIFLWKFEGFPAVGKISIVQGVTSDELRWAVENKIPVKIFDLTGTAGREDRIRGSELVQGKDIRERVERLKELLKKREGKDLSDRLKQPRTIVLVFSASEDAAGLIEKILLDAKDDVRYLIGGYETFALKKDTQAKAAACPTCPGSKEK